MKLTKETAVMNRNNNTKRISELYLVGCIIEHTKRHALKDNLITKTVTYALHEAILFNF